ncbi:MAG: glycosyltransferase [Cellulosilyticaceae bacterium]
MCIFMLEWLVVLKEKIEDTFRLLIIGERSLKEELEQSGADLQLEDNIRFVGNVPNNVMSDYYRACEVFVFASRSETQGIVLLEAMVERNPIVVFKASGVVDVVALLKQMLFEIEETSHEKKLTVVV